MKKMFAFLMSGFFVLFCAASLVYAGGKAGKSPHWAYSGEHGPGHWGDLCKTFVQCKTGKNQTPINITGYVSAKLKPVYINYGGKALEITNNGHTVKVNYQPYSAISIDGKKFELKQFHFHTPSENLIDDASFPMEAHFVHADRNGALAVIGVMYLVGKKSNRGIEKLLSQMPYSPGDKHKLNSVVNALELMPLNKSYYRFTGSLTTPPCSEGVYWIVMKTPVTISREQLMKFKQVMGDNNRPICPLNSRVILSSP